MTQHVFVISFGEPATKRRGRGRICAVIGLESYAVLCLSSALLVFNKISLLVVVVGWGDLQKLLQLLLRYRPHTSYRKTTSVVDDKLLHLW